MEGVETITWMIVEAKQKEIEEKSALKRIRSMRQETIKRKVATLLYLP